MAVLSTSNSFKVSTQLRTSNSKVCHASNRIHGGGGLGGGDGGDDLIDGRGRLDACVGEGLGSSGIGAGGGTDGGLGFITRFFETGFMRFARGSTGSSAPSLSS